MTAPSVENLTDGQLEVLKQLKKNTADVVQSSLSDVWLIKWLRKHNYNLKKTEDALRDDARFREIYDLNTIADTYVKPEVICKYEFTCLLGIAKNGSPIRYTRMAAGDYMGLLMSLSGYQIALYTSYLVEGDLAILRKENKKSGRDVAEITYIVDMEGCKIQQLLHTNAMEVGRDLIQVMQDHYPEVWGNILVINAPIYFDKLFHIFKPILNLNMLRKINLASRESSPTLLLEYIDKDELPAFLGGERVDSFGNPKCTEFVKFGNKIPEELYLRNLPFKLLESDSAVTTLWVSARCVHNHSVVVRKTDSFIKVEFRSENGSIGFKMLFRELDNNNPGNVVFPPCDGYLDETIPSSNVSYVSPYVRMQSHMSPIDQKVKAPWPGIYIFRFDNTHSWFTPKKIIFRIRLMN